MSTIFIPLLIFLFPLAYSPGPGNLFFAALGARSGFVSTLPALAGYHIATVSLTAAIGLGVLRITGQSEAVSDVMRYAGATYVLFLAYKFAGAGAVAQDGPLTKASFGSGALILLLNPKAYVIIGLMFSQFLTATSSALMVIAISVVFTLNNLLAFGTWAILGDQTSRLFRSKGSARVLNLIFACMLAGVSIWMAVG